MSKKVKIVLVEDGSYDDDYSNAIIRDGISDWEEISDEDYKFLKKNSHLLTQIIQTNVYNYNCVLKIIVQDDIPIKVRINSIKEELVKIKNKQEEAARKREEQKLARELKRKAKDEASEKKLFEELKKKFEAT